ncbi:hypothetical protein VTH06DRAFT_7703 [Thermothelomyces fergusii]
MRSSTSASTVCASYPSLPSNKKERHVAASQKPPTVCSVKTSCSLNTRQPPANNRDDRPFPTSIEPTKTGRIPPSSQKTNILQHVRNEKKKKSKTKKRTNIPDRASPPITCPFRRTNQNVQTGPATQPFSPP